MGYFFDKILQVYKNVRISGAKFQYVAGQSFNCSLQPSTPEETQFVDGQIGSVFNCYTFPECDAEIGNKIIIDGTDYKVRGLSLEDFGSLQHIKMILVKSNDN